MLSRLCTTARLVTGTFVFFVFVVLLKLRHWTSDYKWYYNPIERCNHTEKELEALIEVTRRTHRILQRQRIDHILCYGSLFGALRQEAILPWDQDVDLCIIADDLVNLEEELLKRLFKIDDIDLQYDVEEGVYHARYHGARCDIIVFEYSDDYQWIRRVGIKQRIRSDREQFPSRLMAPPLPLKKLNGLEMPVPREDMELQKHLYPNSYWKEIKPPNC